MQAIAKLTLFLPLFSVVANISTLYNLRDLEILAEEKNFREFFKHAQDIRPIDRNKQWKEMLRTMATGMISDYLLKKRLDKAHYNRVEALMDGPALKNDEVFLRKREEFALHHLAQCFAHSPNKDLCQATLEQFWNSTAAGPAKQDLGVQIVQLLQRFKIPGRYWQYIKNSVKGQLSQMICRKKIIQSIVLAEMTKVIEHTEKEILREIQLEKLASNECWDIMIPDIKGSLSTGPRRMQEALYTLLKLRAKLSKEEENLFLTRFILDGPYNGAIFNRAWNTLKKLGESYQTRKKVLEHLTAADPLPDQLFEYSSLARNKIIINHLHRNMPEYLDHYARTCISFYQGSKKFPLGNPTLYCRNLFQAINKYPEAKSWVDPSTNTQFKALNL